MIEEKLPGLYCVEGDVSGLVPPSFLAVRSNGGNLLFGSGHGISRHFDDMKKLGPVSGVFVGDRHHLKSYSPAASYFDAPLSCSKAEAKIAQKKGVIVDQLVEFRRYELYDDLEIIPTPGHTPGALSYLWTSGRHRVLFIGDTIVPVDGEWRAWVNKKHMQEMIYTLGLLADLDFNYIAVGSFAATGEKLIRLTPKSKKALLEAVVNSLTNP
jgi:glyoxylase-like metal-dependent hydrolase (beta-lactamase superfamily II)